MFIRISRALRLFRPHAVHTPSYVSPGGVLERDKAVAQSRAKVAITLSSGCEGPRLRTAIHHRRAGAASPGVDRRVEARQPPERADAPSCFLRTVTLVRRVQRRDLLFLLPGRHRGRAWSREEQSSLGNYGYKKVRKRDPQLRCRSLVHDQATSWGIDR